MIRTEQPGAGVDAFLSSSWPWMLSCTCFISFFTRSKSELAEKDHLKPRKEY